MSAATDPQSASPDVVLVLAELARLRDADELTEEEFQAERRSAVAAWRVGRPARPTGSA